MSTLFRRRLIPNECVSLKDDSILVQNNTEIITIWQTLRPKPEFAKGISYYILEKGWKISKFFNAHNELVYIYCDIISVIYDDRNDAYTFVDYLADVIVENNGLVRVVDLNELATANVTGIIDNDELVGAIYKLNDLLGIIYSGEFEKYIKKIDQYIDQVKLL